MILEIKKSFNILAKNPYITLLFIIYLLIIASAMPVLYVQTNLYKFIFIALLFILLTAAFCAGWFGMVQKVVAYKETGNLETDIKNQYLSFKNDFFASIPQYILPLLFYILLFSLYAFGLFRLADFIIGKPNEILNTVGAISGGQVDVVKFLEMLPHDVKILIFKRIAFISAGNILYFFLTLYSIPALYFENGCNPIKAIFKGIYLIFKKPLFSAELFALLVFANFLLHLFETVSMVNQIVMFLALVLRVYFMAYIVVLIFSVYENKFTDNCNNGSDSIG